MSVVPRGESGKDQAGMHTSEILRTILPAAGGSFVEWYEFAIYGYLSPYITANFFEGHGGSIGTWSGYACAFLFRPLGGALFGWMGDRYGRKLVMQVTIAAMLVTTVLQGCLPTFRSSGEAWGWVGLVLLLLFRIVQGLSCGGELPTAAVYIAEVSPPEKLGFNLSFLASAGMFASWGCAALVVFLIECSMSHDDMMDWGWRIPYITSIFPGALVIWCRRHLGETADFEALVGGEADKATTKQVEEGAAAVPADQTRNPWQELWAEHKLPLLVGTLGAAGIGTLLNVPTIFGVQFISMYSGLSRQMVTFGEMLVYVFPTFLTLLSGKLVDVWGTSKVHTLAVVLGAIVAPVPLFYWWAHVPPQNAILSVCIGQCILGVLLSLCNALYLWLAELFPVQVRNTGVAITYSFGLGVFGGMGPLLCDVLNRVVDPRGLISAPAGYTVASGLLSLLAIIASKLLAKHGMMQLTHIRHSPY